jgi:hypothetical protein
MISQGPPLFFFSKKRSRLIKGGLGDRLDLSAYKVVRQRLRIKVPMATELDDTVFSMRFACIQ